MVLDGNKRTSMFAGNHVMISNGTGIISIPIEYQRDFTAFLIKFYETSKNIKIIDFIFERCIDGMNLG